MAASLRQNTEEEHNVMMQRKAEYFGIPEEKRFIYKRYMFEGVIFYQLTPPENIAGVRDWKTREDDIFILTYPKSGTHWMYEIVQLILANGYSEKIDRSKMMISTLEMLHPPDMVKPTYEILDTEESPRVIMTHLPWQFLPKQLTEQKKGKIIYLMRNPKDVLTSTNRFWLSTSGKEVEKNVWQYLFKNFLTGDVAWGSWFDHVEKYWKHRNQENVFFTSYEQLKKDFKSVVKPLSTFLGLELDEDALERVEENSTVKAMKKTYDDIEKNVPGGVRMVKAHGRNSFVQKGVIGSWKDYFTVAENELFDQVYKEKMANWEMDVVFE
ncbi:Sulfotransferase family cytosolic 1B member 1 [Holothuria leucospilota]|uniref:Sulfotransferase family cytosolic 1B member 1 n=1 Tax=Holothuria leucospilota TaxID=206669 RepID=A0A9Q1C835_HOLLE|nr:Sulfotransferase family cytosolic 1B member 1 [Holothuria leucospilota]